MKVSVSAFLKSLCCVKSQEDEPVARGRNGRLSSLNVMDEPEQIPLTLNQQQRSHGFNIYEGDDWRAAHLNLSSLVVDNAEHIYEPIGEPEAETDMVDFEPNPFKDGKKELELKPVKKTRAEVSQQFLPHVRTTLLEDESVSIPADYAGYSWAS